MFVVCVTSLRYADNVKHVCIRICLRSPVKFQANCANYKFILIFECSYGLEYFLAPAILCSSSQSVCYFGYYEDSNQTSRKQSFKMTWERFNDILASWGTLWRSYLDVMWLMFINYLILNIYLCHSAAAVSSLWQSILWGKNFILFGLIWFIGPFLVLFVEFTV